MRGVRLRVALGVALALAALTLATPSSSGAAPSLASGYGAIFGQWVRTHPPDAKRCAIGSCYGPLVTSVTLEPEFSFVQTFRGHVVGYDESLPRGTSLLQAELEIAQQFPADVSMSRSLTVIRRDDFGHSCAVYDLYSKSLAHEFGSKGPARQGDSIGVELATVAPNGATKYNPTSIDLAIISPVYVDNSIDC